MTQEYRDISDMWRSVVEDLVDRHKTGSRNGKMREIIGWSGQLGGLHSTLLTNTRRKLSEAYAYAELAWYLARESDVTRVAHYAPQYVNYAQPDGHAFGAYGARVAHNVQGHDLLWDVVERLHREHVNDRRVVVSLWRPEDLCAPEEIRDLPCNICWQFLVRDQVLHMCCYMRSNDVWVGMPYDVFVNTAIQRCIADELGIGYGSYTHTIGSLHLYEKHEKAAREALKAPDHPTSDTIWAERSRLSQAKWFCDWEYALRIGEWKISPFETCSMFGHGLSVLAEFNKQRSLSCSSSKAPI